MAHFNTGIEKNTVVDFQKIKRLEALILEFRLTQKQFANSVGVAAGTLSQVLNGKRNITLAIALKIKQKYSDVSIDWLMKGEGDMFKTPPPEKTNGAVLDDCAKVRADNADLRERLLNATTELIRVQSELIEAQRKIIGLQEGKT